VTLVTLDPALCPTCGAVLSTGSWDEPALLRHGGYGASRRTTARYCGNCSFVLIAEQCEARP
jgi:hypothetical protein